MPTILSHPAVPLALGIAVGSKIVSSRLLLAGVIASALPDIDVLAFRFGISYSDTFGHRGATHSLAFALVLALIAFSFASRLDAKSGAAFWFVLAAGASHGLLDMLTNGGHGIALFWPFTIDRYFFPAQVIEVSPIGWRFFSVRGMAVFTSELVWVWLPAACLALAAYGVRRGRINAESA